MKNKKRINNKNYWHYIIVYRDVFQNGCDIKKKYN